MIAIHPVMYQSPSNFHKMFFCVYLTVPEKKFEAAAISIEMGRYFVNLENNFRQLKKTCPYAVFVFNYKGPAPL